MKKNLLLLNFFGLFLFALFLGAGNANAAFTSQPASVTVCAGTSTISFSVKTDYLLPSYQWQYYSNGVWTNMVDGLDLKTNIEILGSNSTKFSITWGKGGIPTSFSGAIIRCAVLSGKGTYYSNQAVTTVVSAPSITSNPSSASVLIDQAVTFSVSASGSGLSYQWQLDKGSGYVNISGATTASYTIKYAALTDAGTYRCMVTNGICTAKYSTGAVLSVYGILSIDKNPSKKTACESTTATFSVTATNATGYQWEVLPYKSSTWTTLSGANASSYTTPTLTTNMNENQYRVVVFGGGGQSLTSYSAFLYVNSNVSIYSHPASASKIVGESVTFTVGASGYVSGYQWQLNNVNISGANSSSFTIGSVQLSDLGSYRCVVSGCNTAYSTAAVLTVTAPTYPDAWFLQSTPTSKDITKVAAVSDLVAWGVLSDYDKMVKTTNGGTDWSYASTGLSTAQFTYWYAIDFLTSNLGLVGGYNRIAKTDNGGTSWTDYDVKTSLALTDWPTIYDIQLVSSTIGYAVGTGGLVMKTSDGGATWVKQIYHTDASPVTDAVLRSVFFLDVSNGFAAGENGVILKTTNGGTNWTKLTTPTTYYLQDIEFANSSIGFAVSTSGILKTTNGGTNWSIASGIPSLYAYGIDFVDANNGYLSGYYWSTTQIGTVLKTNDGGVTWYRQKMEGTNLVYHLEMANANHGFAVGDAGQVHRTAKGGCLTPKVNLYSDQSLCSGSSLQLVADTFINNLNCKYVWTPNGETSGKLNVSSSNTYGVTVTNECGITASDNVVIDFLALPSANAGNDVSICNGESAQLLATGGTSYLWNNAGLLNDHQIANPIATPPIGSTTFTVTVTDANNCSSSDAVKVTVNPIPSSDFSAPTFVCGTESTSLQFSGTVGSKTFTWDLAGGNADGTGAGPFNVNWTELGDKLVSLVTTENNCSSLPTLKVISVREQPTASFEAPVATCSDNSAVLIYTGSAPSDASYSWGIDGGTITSGANQGPIMVSWATPGNKSLSLSVTQNECVSDVANADLTVAYPFEGEQICLVTIDLETGKNMVVWEKTHGVGIASYNVYREGTIQNNYDLLGNVPFEEISVFVDANSKPEQQQYKYKISAVDTCGNESSKSKWHKTMFLQYVSSDNGVNLNWQEYGVESGAMSFDSYAIFRGSDSTALAELTTISASFLAYTDNTTDALSKKMYYRVGGVKANACDPAEIGGKKASSGPFVHSLSNLEDNRLQSGGTGINNALADAMKLSVYPSPFTDLANISYTLQKTSKVRIEVYNVVGEKVTELLNETQSMGNHKVEMKASDVNYTGGMYYLKINVDGVSIVRKTMLNR